VRRRRFACDCISCCVMQQSQQLSEPCVVLHQASTHPGVC
jgi:hypothetical protein